MIETKLMLDAKDHIGRPDLVLCNGARISFFYGEACWYDREAGCMDFEFYAEVVLFESRPPRPWGCMDSIEDLKPIDLPF